MVATPIGNLEDITLRALRILKEADLIACEDTRVARKLLSRYGIETPTISYFQHSKISKTERIIRELLDGKNVALTTDAGTPGISDPGNILVAEAAENGIKTEPIPGPSALTECFRNQRAKIRFYGVSATQKRKKKIFSRGRGNKIPRRFLRIAPSLHKKP